MVDPYIYSDMVDKIIFKKSLTVQYEYDLYYQLFVCRSLI